MSRKQELALLYAKERRRVQSFYSRYRKKNYAIPENAIPARPKRITEGSIRRLQRMTPEFMKRKLVRYEKQLKIEERRQQREAIKTAYSYDIPTTPSYSEEDYQTSYAYTDYDWYDVARNDRDATYLQQINDNEKRVEFAERYYDKQITDMSESELQDIGYTKTPDGYILQESTGEIVARDMSAEIEANNNFIDELAQFEDMPADALDAFKTQEEKDKDIQDYVKEVNDRIKQGKQQGKENEQGLLKGRSNESWAQQIINNFIKDIRRFPTMAYPFLTEVLDSLLNEVSDRLNVGKEALANAIQGTVDELGRVTREVAYSTEALNDYARFIADKYYDNLKVLDSLNATTEESDLSW